MLSKNTEKYIRSLHHAKYRKKYGSFIAEGPTICNELLKEKADIERILALPTWYASPAGQQAPDGTEQVTLTPGELKKISALTTPNQVLFVVRIPKPHLDASVIKDHLVLALENIRDPGNMGTIVRLADWFGIPAVICSNQCVDLYNPKVIQSTMGSFARVHVFYRNLAEVLKEMKGKTRIFGSAMNGSNIYGRELQSSAIIVIGNESHGISSELHPYIDEFLAIPQYKKGAESLNASVAAAIIVSEFRKNMLAGNN
ncbi:MAG: RNA methyltransferase [Bacteroidales bacterium]